MLSVMCSPLQPLPRVRAQPRSDDENNDGLDAWKSDAMHNIYKNIYERLLSQRRGNGFAEMEKKTVILDITIDENHSSVDRSAAVRTRGSRHQTP